MCLMLLGEIQISLYLRDVRQILVTTKKEVLETAKTRKKYHNL